MNDLLYLEGLASRNEEDMANCLLPHPLGEGEEPRKAPDGSRVWNPQWDKGPTEGSTNREYITAAIALLKNREAVSLNLKQDFLSDATPI